MTSFIQFFETIPSHYRALILISGLTIFWSLESIIPLFRKKYRKWRHAGPNLFFNLTTIIVNFVFAALILYVSDRSQTEGFGVLNWLGLSIWSKIVVGLLLLDFVGAYLIHLIEHKVKWMWKFHVVHHTDANVDVTTSLRHHPVESIFRAIFAVIAVGVTGAPMWLVMLYQSLSVVFSQFNHANIKLSPRLDKLLSYIIISPDMHKVHHHYVLPYTDTNYGNIFSFWDRLLGTYGELDRQDIVYGLDTHFEKQDQENLGRMLKIPFMPYRSPVGSKYASKE